MAKFMDVHSGFIGVTAEQLKEAHERDLAIEVDERRPFRTRLARPGARQGVLPCHRPDARGGHARARTRGPPDA